MVKTTPMPRRPDLCQNLELSQPGVGLCHRSELRQLQLSQQVGGTYPTSEPGSRARLWAQTSVPAPTRSNEHWLGPGFRSCYALCVGDIRHLKRQKRHLNHKNHILTTFNHILTTKFMFKSGFSGLKRGFRGLKSGLSGLK